MAHRHSDKSGERYWHIAVPLAFGIIGFVIAAATMNTAARYISLLVDHKSSASNPLSFYVPTTGFWWLHPTRHSSLSSRGWATRFLDHLLSERSPLPQSTHSPSLGMLPDRKLYLSGILIIPSLTVRLSDMSGLPHGDLPIDIPTRYASLRMVSPLLCVTYSDSTSRRWTERHRREPQVANSRPISISYNLLDFQNENTTEIWCPMILAPERHWISRTCI